MWKAAFFFFFVDFIYTECLRADVLFHIIFFVLESYVIEKERKTELQENERQYVLWYQYTDKVTFI